MKRVIILIILALFFSFTTCFAARELPITSLNVTEFVNRINDVLARGNENIRLRMPGRIKKFDYASVIECNSPKPPIIFFDVDPSGSIYRLSLAYVSSNNLLKDETNATIAATTAAAVLAICGLNFEELDVLMHKNVSTDKDGTIKSHVWCEGMNRNYAIFIRGNKNVGSITLGAFIL